MLRKITSIICIVIGIIVIVMGTSLSKETADHEVDGGSYRYSAVDYDLPYAAFGGDFYTDIYEGSDVIVDVLNDINKSVETVVKAENGIYEATAANIAATDALIETVCAVGSKIMMAIGLVIVALGVCSLGKAFAPAAPAPAQNQPTAPTGNYYNPQA